MELKEKGSSQKVRGVSNSKLAASRNHERNKSQPLRENIMNYNPIAQRIAM